MARPDDWAALQALLREYNERPAERDRIEAEIDRRFRRDAAILVLDSCGFTRGTRRHGIIHALAQMERLERLVVPILGRHGGRLLRVAADNLFAVFSDVAAAVAAAGAILDTIAVVNEALAADEEMEVAIGVGHGSVLLIDANDVYGDEMNLASKLGEDLAGRGEILLTPAARAALPESAGPFEERTYSVSGLSVTVYQLTR